MKSVLSALCAAMAAAALMSGPALAKCEDIAGCNARRIKIEIKRVANHTRPAKVPSRAAANTKAKPVQSIAQNIVLPAAVPEDFGTRHAAMLAPPAPIDATDPAKVIAAIETMAPRYGVPIWFALRIAKIESNYDPSARGLAGEYGVFQIKCNTARMLGFGGDCSELADARTGIYWGLRHLSEALVSSNWDLRLAASKHNGGLARKTLVPHYVRLVF